jgi:hypothetical protein
MPVYVISLLATHSNFFEKIILKRVRTWSGDNILVPSEQSGFRPNYIPPTRVLSICQKIKNNMTANLLIFFIYVNYQKAYDRVQYITLKKKIFY